MQEVAEDPHALSVSLPAAIAGCLFFSAACLIFFLAYRDLVPPMRLGAWSFGTCLLVLYWGLSIWRLKTERPDPLALARTWAPVARGILLSCHLVALGVVWLLLPEADLNLTMLTAAFFFAYIPTQIVCSPENSTINRLGIVVVWGSLILCLLIKGLPYAWHLSVFTAFYGAVMYFVSDVLLNTMKESVRARRQSEKANARLAQLLKAVAEERDAKTRFIAAASHDLGQPLQAAALFFDQTLRAQHPAAREQAAEGVRKAFASAEQLLSHMLNHLRLEADAVQPLLSRFPVRPMLERLAHQQRPLAEQMKMRIRICAGNPVLLLDPVLLERALSNLLVNALHHSGGTRVLLGARRKADGKIYLWVIDDGVGISAIEAPHLFDDFFQGSDSKAPVKSGFGLGLASARRVAHLMQGKAGLDRRWIRGSAFYLSFADPLQQRDRQRVPTPMSVAGG